MREVQWIGLVVILASSFFIVQCGGSKASPRESRASDPHGLSKADAAFFRDLNSVNSDTLEAIQSLLSRTLVEPPSSDKVTAMKALLDKNCQAQSLAHQDASGWREGTSVPASSTCPITFLSSLTYQVVPNILTFEASFQNLSTAFQELSPIAGFHLQGDMEVKRRTNHVRVEGTLTSLDKLHIKNVGDVDILIRIAHTIYKGAQSGIVQAIMTLPGYWQHTGAIYLDKTGTYSYTVDNINISKKDFIELFSFLQLDKIMDKSKVMR